MIRLEIQEEDNTRHRNETNRVMHAGENGANHRLRKELEDNYQSYCRFEKGFTERHTYTLKNSLTVK